MGMQQILLILLSVIIVGIAVTFGLQMFHINAVNNNRNAIIADINNIAANSLAFIRAPRIMGGGEGNWIPYDRPGHADRSAGDALGDWLNWVDYEESAQGDKYYTGNGVVWMNLSSWEGEILTIIASGTEQGRNPSYSSEGHGEKGCIEVKMTISKVTHEMNLEILN